MKEYATEKFKDTIAKKYGVIECYGPNGEFFQCRSLREAMNKTGIHRNTINYAIKNNTSPYGWIFIRQENKGG